MSKQENEERLTVRVDKELANEYGYVWLRAGTHDAVRRLGTVYILDPYMPLRPDEYEVVETP